MAPPSSPSDSGLRIQIEAELSKLQPVVVVLPEKVLQPAREERHGLADGCPVLDVTGGERRQLLGHVCEGHFPWIPYQNIHGVVGRADDRTRLVGCAGRDDRGAARLTKRARPDRVGGRDGPHGARDVRRYRGVTGKLEDRSLCLDLSPEAVEGRVEGVPIANREVPRHQVNLACDLRVARTESDEDRVTARIGHGRLLWIIDADDVQIVVWPARRVVASTGDQRSWGGRE